MYVRREIVAISMAGANPTFSSICRKKKNGGKKKEQLIVRADLGIEQFFFFFFVWDGNNHDEASQSMCFCSLVASSACSKAPKPPARLLIVSLSLPLLSFNLFPFLFFCCCCCRCCSNVGEKLLFFFFLFLSCSSRALFPLQKTSEVHCATH